MIKKIYPNPEKLIPPNIIRIIAPNPGIMTGMGTNTYLIGKKEIAVIDPGPKIKSHIEKILTTTPGPIRWIFATHTHLDHSPATEILAKKTGAKILGIPPPKGKNQDQTFLPHKILSNGETIHTKEFSIQAIHTPGHASNHLCYHLTSQDLLFTGDNIMNGSTVVIDPPDGDMKEYLESLQDIKRLPLNKLLPGHGEPINNPIETINLIIKHRLNREKIIINELILNPNLSIKKLTPLVYKDVGGKLHKLASRSLLAHLIKLDIEGLAIQKHGKWTIKN